MRGFPDLKGQKKTLEEDKFDVWSDASIESQERRKRVQEKIGLETLTKSHIALTIDSHQFPFET